MVPETHLANPRGCPVIPPLLPSRAPPLRVGGGEQSLHFSSPTLAASLCLLSIPASAEPGLRGPPRAARNLLLPASPLFPPARAFLERWGLGVQIPRVIFISNLILQPPALKSLLICKQRWTFRCVCELHTTPQPPQSWAVKPEKCGARSPDRTRKKQLSNRLASCSQVPASQ